MNKQRISETAAGYLELEGAVKDADCEVVEVGGGVSSELGCCNNFSEKPSAKKFSCGTCTFVTGQDEYQDGMKPLGKKESKGMTDRQILDSERPTAEEKEE
jgi:hypothetical protein